MAGKKYTVIIIPDKSSGTRRFGIASRTVWVAAICVLSLFAVNISSSKIAYPLKEKSCAFSANIKYIIQQCTTGIFGK